MIIGKWSLIMRKNIYADQIKDNFYEILIRILSFCYIFTIQASKLIPNTHVTMLIHRYSELEKDLIEKDLLNIQDLFSLSNAQLHY